MTFILRWPAILVLLALVFISLAAGFAALVSLANLPIDLGQVLSPEQIATVQAVTWLEAGLWAGAGVFFLVSSVRLMRRTQGFWSWLLGFACYGGRWAVAQQNEEGLVATVQGVDVNAYMQPQALVAMPESVETQIGMLAIVVIVGLVIFVIDAADRAYWDRQSA